MTEILNWIQKFIYYSSLGNLLTSILSSNLSIDLNVLDYSGYYQLGIDLIGLFAMGMAMIYLCIILVNGLMDGKANREFIFNLIFRFALTLLMIKYGPLILHVLINFGNGILKIVIESYQEVTKTEPITPDGLVGGLFAIVTFLITIIPNLLVILLSIAALNIVTFTRYVELAIYSAGFPLVIPNFMLSEKSSSTIQYIKRFFALCLQGAVLCIIVMACGVFLNNSATDNMIEGSGYMVAWLALGPIPTFVLGSVVAFIKDAALTCMLISMLFRSKKIAMDIIGVK